MFKYSSSFSGTISVSDAEILSTIQKCFRETGYLICPHTATAVKYHYDNPTK
jgi:threonine synthase